MIFPRLFSHFPSATLLSVNPPLAVRAVAATHGHPSLRGVFTIALLGMVLFTGLGCGPKYIKGTRIVDDERTRLVLKTVERYRVAMENRDWATVKAMAHASYFERNGDNNSRNNYDIEGLHRLLESDDFKHVSKLQMTIIYEDVKCDDGGKSCEVRVSYTANWRMPPPRFEETRKTGADGQVEVVADNYDEERWYSKSDVNLFVLILDPDGVWRIARGM